MQTKPKEFPEYKDLATPEGSLIPRNITPEEFDSSVIDHSIDRSKALINILITNLGDPEASRYSDSVVVDVLATTHSILVQLQMLASMHNHHQQ